MSSIYLDFKALRAYAERPAHVETIAHVTDAAALAKLLSMSSLVDLGARVTGKRYGLKSSKLAVAEKIWPQLLASTHVKDATSNRPSGKAPVSNVGAGRTGVQGDPARRPGKTSMARRFHLAQVDPDKVPLVNEHGRLILAELARTCAQSPDGCFGKPEVLQLRSNVDLERRLREAKPTKQSMKLLVAHWLHYLKRWGGILEAKPKKEGVVA